MVISARWSALKVVGAAAPVAQVERVEPVGVEVVDHVADPVRGRCRSPRRCGTGMPWADSSHDLADDIVDELSHRVGVADIQTDG